MRRMLAEAAVPSGHAARALCTKLSGYAAFRNGGVHHEKPSQHTVTSPRRISILALEGEKRCCAARGGRRPRVFRCTRWKASSAFPIKGASPALMGACAQRGICLSFYSPSGRFYCQTSGEPSRATCCLRREQFRTGRQCRLPCRALACSFLTGKLYNCPLGAAAHRARPGHACGRPQAEACRAGAGRGRQGAAAAAGHRTPCAGPKARPRRCISMCSMS